jgi:putative protease
MIACPIELLSPAKDLACGMEAVRHGADAVYIGAPKFGARANAGNSVEDISRLCDYAHLFNVKVFVAMNTLLKDEELVEAEKMIHRLYHAGMDALIVQDMGITQLDLPPVPLHASTQVDNRTPEKIAFLQQAGFTRVILARELTLEEICEIRAHTSVQLEVFVHGALCVGLSGLCYLSAALTGRSANRGECAQCCRLPFSLRDADGKTVLSGKHLLSLKDLNRTDDLESLIKAGVSSLKIEGRLKDVSYVKNITACYRQKLDEIFTRNPAYYRASTGTSVFSFQPQPEKSFNRGFTSFFLHGRTPEIASFDTPKSIGEPTGKVKAVKDKSFTLAPDAKPVHNGDGLVFINRAGELEGFRVNRTDNNEIYPLQMPSLRPGTLIRRNYDKAFEDRLAKHSAERKLAVSLFFYDTPFGFALEATDETEAGIIISIPFEKAHARTSQEDNIRTQLMKWGNTPFLPTEIRISLSHSWFVPSSFLREIRCEASNGLERIHRIQYQRPWVKREVYRNTSPCPAFCSDHRLNIANRCAATFYALHGIETAEKAFELSPRPDAALMQTKHCLKYSLGWCPVHHGCRPPFREPFILTYKQTRLRLAFDCRQCEMSIYLLK